MKVWIISDGCACGWYSGIDIKGIYSTEEKAREALDKMKDGEYLSVEEFEVE